MQTYTTTIVLDGSTPEDDITLELEVDFDATKPSRGARGPNGEQLEPDEEGTLEIVGIRLIPDAGLLQILAEELVNHLATPNN
jgi:hypothetical protein